jgi:NAD+ diphosphatase
VIVPPEAGDGSRPPLARSAVDRAAHLRGDEEWLAAAWRTALVLVVDTVAGGRALVTDEGGAVRLVLLPSAEAPAATPDERLFLGVDADGTALFAIDAPLGKRPGARAVTLRDVGHLLDDREAGLFTAGVALANWHTAHPYSPATGQLTAVREAGWTRVDPGGQQFWPRTDPAVIVLVHDGVAGPDGRCLLGHAGLWRAEGVRRFSCLAGFVEAGESAEAAVAREVGEEVGVEVGHLEYVGSQAWPFPQSLMLGFTAYADPAQPVRVDRTEIAEARWFSRREVAAAYAGERVDLGDGDALALPTNASIAAFLVDRWLRRD